MAEHIAKITSVCYYHLRRQKQVGRILGAEIAARLVSAYIISRLDYCNSVMTDLPKASITPLQRVQNAAVGLIKLLGLRDHISSTIRDLHWLPVKYRITYKLCTMMHAANNHQCSGYIAELLTATSSVVSRSRLRSASSNRYEVHRTRLQFRHRAFLLAGPTAWNSLQQEITDIPNTEHFKVQLKTCLCTLAYINNYD